MDGWDSWERPSSVPLKNPSAQEAIANALVAAREASRRERVREIVWDRGMPQESRELVYPDDPRWDRADRF